MKKKKTFTRSTSYKNPGRGEGGGGWVHSCFACLTVVERPISRKQLPIFNRSFISCERLPPPPNFLFMHMFAPIISAANPSPGEVIFYPLISLPPSSCNSMIEDVVEGDGDGDGKHLTWPTILIIVIIVQHIIGMLRRQRQRRRPQGQGKGGNLEAGQSRQQTISTKKIGQAVELLHTLHGTL